MDINVVKFRQRYRNQLMLILGQYHYPIELDDPIKRLKEHPHNSYYYYLNLAMAQKRLEEIR